MSEDNDNKSRRGELEDMMSAIGGPLQKAMINLGTKIAKKELFELWNNFKRLLATASDPFFRKDMGERYFNAGSVTNGILLWMAIQTRQHSCPSCSSHSKCPTTSTMLAPENPCRV